MPYAVLSKDVDYSEERLEERKRPDHNPFEIFSAKGTGVVDGEVVSKREFTFSARA